MKVTLEALAVLDAIDRRGSFAAAAEELHRVPSAITYTVQKLESDLGVRVFDRSGHRARLTPAGQRLLVEGRQLLLMAGNLERMVKRVATGWEAELAIAVGELVPMAGIMTLLEEFFQEPRSTRLRILAESRAGTWEALASGRADLVIGAVGDAPPAAGYVSRPLGRVELVFVVSPRHPLAGAPEPLAEEAILRHRAVAAADSSRRLPPRPAILTGVQEVLDVPDVESQCEAQRRGLGVGYVPRYRVQADLDAGRLIAKTVAGGPPSARLSIAWRPDAMGKALKWFLARLQESSLFRGVVN